MRQPLPQARLVSVLIPIAALLWLAPAPVRAQRTLDAEAAAATYENGIEKDLNPFTAAAFLRDQSVLGWLGSADKDRQARLVTHATELKDLSDMLQAHSDYPTLVNALTIRLRNKDEDGNAPYFGFGLEPAKFSQWNDQWGALGDPAVLRKALLEFDTLNPGAKDYLVKEKKIAESAWQKTSFEDRKTALKPLAQRVLDNIKKLNPKTQDDLDAMRKTANDIAPLLGSTEVRLMWERVHMASESVDSFAKLDAVSARLNEPGVAELLAQAKGSSDIEGTLSKLSQIFDKLGIPNKALQSQRPTTAADQFTDDQRKLLGTELGTALLAQTAGTDAGDDLTAFFNDPKNKHDMKITIMSMPSNLAEYRFEEKDLVFNERFIMDWAKGEGLTAKDLTTNGDALTKLAMLLSPNFVHEARHQEQQAWAKEKGFIFQPGQNYEVEAKGVEALFFLQKSKNEAFKKFYGDSRDSSMLARQEIMLADTLSQKGAPKFRNIVMSDYYEDLPSLDAMTASDMQQVDASIAFVRKELDRRQKLPQTEQDAVEKNGKTLAKGQKFKDWQEWRAYAAQATTTSLKQDLENKLVVRDKMVESYGANADRSDDFQMYLDTGLRKLGSGASRNEPPSPQSP